MEKPNKTEQLIDDFLFDRMSEEERIAFLEQKKQDPELAAKFQKQQALLEGIENFNRKELKKKLQAVHEAVIPKTPPRRLRGYLPWLAAAAILLAIFLFINYSSQEVSPQALYQKYFSPYPLQLTQRDHPDPQLIQLEQLYQKAAYSESLPLFHTVLSENPDQIKLQLGLGIALLESGNPEEAIAQFKAINDSGDLLFHDQALWYSALAYLQLNQIGKCTSALQELVEDNNADHHEEAVDLLDALN